MPATHTHTHTHTHMHAHTPLSSDARASWLFRDNLFITVYGTEIIKKSRQNNYITHETKQESPKFISHKTVNRIYIHSSDCQQPTHFCCCSSSSCITDGVSSNMQAIYRNYKVLPEVGLEVFCGQAGKNILFVPWKPGNPILDYQSQAIFYTTIRAGNLLHNY